ncbi:NAD kinase [Rhynchospora pubera]|uniref:NADH kinase n=1 Tax=Rhynchospora pubera TaxID=906938 RepID=A0AAV8FAC5_9POAL|nr:NAD kinase [Rhynchospora pubera]
MARRRVLLLLKPLDVYPPRPLATSIQTNGDRTISSKILRHLDDRCRAHKETIDHCKSIIERRNLDWELIMRNNLSKSICHVDLVITVGGDGTLLKASHFMDGSVPVLGVNSDPTNDLEVEEMSEEFDATRSTGYLCAATRGNFEQVLDEVLEGKKQPTELSRISLKIKGAKVQSCALNDILMAHPCPASVSRFSFRIKKECGETSQLINCRSSGLRVSTAAGSTAAMQSAGGIPMHISMPDLQYMVREPIFPREADIPLMHGFIKPNEGMAISWYSQEGMVYFDGSHVYYKIRHGDVAEVSSDSPALKVFLQSSLLT